MTIGKIELRGVHVHNLKHVDLDIPHDQLIVFCGVSGSGKTSLALDTLYAEGQRRYIESFSAYTRQFLERLTKPAAESIEGIPPAIAVTHKNSAASSRSTVGTATEIIDYLRLLYSRVGQLYCTQCQRVVASDSSESTAERLQRLPEKTRLMVAFRLRWEPTTSLQHVAQSLQGDGFVRWIVGSSVLATDEAAAAELPESGIDEAYVIVDRLTAGQSSPTRIRESIETAITKGNGACYVFVPSQNDIDPAAHLFEHQPSSHPQVTVQLDGREWVRVGFSSGLRCEDCDIAYPQPEPRLFSFNSPLGACPTCEGFGNVAEMDMELIVPDSRKSISDGAIAPWNSPAYQHHLKTLVNSAKAHGLPIHVPFRELTPSQIALVTDGIPDSEYRGLNGFFASMNKGKYKMHIRTFLSRWRSSRLCPACHGSRLRTESLAFRVAGLNIADICRLKIADTLQALDEMESSLNGQQVGRHVGQTILDQVRSRLHFLEMVGLGYLTLERTLKTLSGGEAQRVSLTSALGSSLVNMLYVLDEPSIGLHPADIDRLLHAVRDLRDRGNTVVLVEHEETMIQAADRVIEIGPAAGENGGTITFEGTPEQLCSDQSESITGEYLTRRLGFAIPEKRRDPSHGWIRITNARGNNLQQLDVEFPLGVLCLVTGVSGAGKSSLVEQTLYPAICRRKRKDAMRPLPYDDIFGDGQIDDVLLIDQSPIGRSPRSNPVTYIKAFDAIRSVYADTLQARTRNLKASHFSFNVEGGRCESCKGDGSVTINMQFLADVVVDCAECRGLRYRPEVLDVKYRGQSIADVLNMTVRQASRFFRGQTKVQSRLHKLMDVGLDYLRLGQPANALSAGEAQRLKLAGYLSAPRRGRTLFLLDEPTTGLHFRDVIQLLDCFDALLELGHSLIVIEHNVQMMRAADFIIDVGPGAAEQGGQIVATGSPEAIATVPASVTGKELASSLREHP